MAGLRETLYSTQARRPSRSLEDTLYGTSLAVNPDDYEQAAIQNTGDFGRGLSSALTGSLSSVQRYLGANESALANQREAARWAPEIQTTDQVTDFGTGARYVAGALGEAAGSLPPALVGGVAGRALAGARGAYLGASAAYQPVMAGSHMQELDANPNTAGMSESDKRWRGTGIGALQAGVEGLAPGYMINRLAKPQALVKAGLAPAVGRAGKVLVTDAAIEGGGAAVSDIIGQGSIMQLDPATAYNPNQTFQAGVREAVGGAGMGAVHAPLAVAHDYLDKAARESGSLAGRGARAGIDAVAPAAARDYDATADLFKTSADFHMQHPEFAGLTTPLSMPEGMKADDTVGINAYLDEEGAKRNAAAKTMAQRMLDNPDMHSNEDLHEAQSMLNTDDPDAWEGFANGVSLRQKRENVVDALGRFTSYVNGKYEGIKEKAGELKDKAADELRRQGVTGLKHNMESTGQDHEFLQSMNKSFSTLPPLDLGDTDLTLPLHALKKYVLSGMRDEDGAVDVPDALVEALGDKASIIIARAYDTLRRQGRTEHIDADAPTLLQEAAEIIKEKQGVQQDVAKLVGDSLTPTAFDTMHHSTWGNIGQAVNSYINHGKKDARLEDALDQWFGPNKEKVMTQIAQLHQKDRVRGQELGSEEDTARDSKDFNEDSASDGTGSDYENPLTEKAPAVAYHFKDAENTPFDRADPFAENHMADVPVKLDTSRFATTKDKAGTDRVRAEQIGVVDHARETGDSSVLDKLMEQYPGMTQTKLNERFRLLKTQERMPDESEAMDIKPRELLAPAEKRVGGKRVLNKHSWQDVAELGGKDVSTTEFGRLYLTPGRAESVNKETGEITPAVKEGKEFITSAQKIISKMWKRGVETGSSPQAMLEAFSTGLSSLLATGKFHGEMQVKLPDGSMKIINGMKDLPDSFVLFRSKDRVVTVKEARESGSKAVRTERAKEQVVAKDEAGHELIFKDKKAADKAVTNKDQMVAEHGKNWAVYDNAPESTTKPGIAIDVEARRLATARERGKGETAGPIGERSVGRADDGKLRGARNDHHGLAESDERAIQTNKEFEAKERRVDELTGLELQPRGVQSADQRVRLLDRRIDALRTEYKALNDKIKEYEVKTGVNAVREGNLKKWRAELEVVKAKGLKLGAERTELGRVVPVAEKAAESSALQKIQEARAKARAEKPDTGVKHNMESTALHKMLNKQGFAATHDSPIKHEGKFDWRKHIGKGEGNAAFGAGTYLSTADGVHKSYKKQFTAQVGSQHSVLVDGKLVTSPYQKSSTYKSLSPAEKTLLHIKAQSPKLTGKELIVAAQEDAVFQAEMNLSMEMEKLIDDIGYGEESKALDRAYGVISDPKTGEKSQGATNLPLLRKLAFEGGHKGVITAVDDMDGVALLQKEIGKIDPSRFSTPLKSSPTYQVSVNIKPEELLDWDKPLSEQSELVQKALKSEEGLGFEEYPLNPKYADSSGLTGVERDTGAKVVRAWTDGGNALYELSDGRFYYDAADPDEYVGIISTEQAKGVRDVPMSAFYRTFAKRHGSQAKASDYLQSLGILGHKYAASGGKNDQHPNYVIYDDSRIETNYVSFNKEKTGMSDNRPMNDVEAIDLLHKLLGKDIDAAFTAAGALDGSGTWRRDPKTGKALIRIAIDALDPTSIAYHESMHEFMQRLLDDKHSRASKVLQDAANSEPVLRQMIRHFADEPAVKKQLETDPAERVAYMFQLWAADKIHIGPQTETVFRKIVNMIKKVLGFATNDKNALEIMQNFAMGQMSDRGAIARVLNTQESRGAYLRKVGTIMKPVVNSSAEWVGFAENALSGSKNPSLDWIGRQLHNKTGSQGDKQGYLSAEAQENNKWMNKFAEQLAKGDKEDVALAVEGLQAKTWHADPIVLSIQKGIAGVFDEMYDYMQTAGVKRWDEKANEWTTVRKVKDYRLPVSWDVAKIIADSEKFKNLLFEHHKAALTKIASQANDEIANKKHAGKYTASWAELNNPTGKPVTEEDIADALLKRVISTNGQVELQESASSMGFSPFAKAVNERTLSNWINSAAFAEFQEKDITNILSAYVGQMTKRAEYTRRFGPDGGILQAKMDEAWEFEIDQLMKEKHGIEGAVAKARAKAPRINKDGSIETESTKGLPAPSDDLASQLSALAEGIDGKEITKQATKNLEPARKAIMAMEGTLGHDISPLLRKATAYSIVYTNVRLLGYAMFSNLIDPLGIMVRGGEFKDAYSTFKRGMRDVGREWGNLTGLREPKPEDRDEAVRVAEMIGTVDNAGFMSTMGTMYGSQFLGKWAREANDNFFRWNGMEAFNKAMRVGATQAAISFIKRHYEKPNKHSERYFKELNLSRDDVKLGEDGSLNVENPAVQQAIMRWVDGAQLRPNAAIRPTMASDPHYATFYHLKQFMYAMQAVILKRVQIEIKNGNTDPLILLLAGYVPMMLAADAAKGLLQAATGGGAPMWEHQGVAGVVSHGIQRAGLLGVGQMAVDVAGYGPAGLGGPMVEQAASAVTDPMGKTVAEAVAVGPLNMALKGTTWTNN